MHTTTIYANPEIALFAKELAEKLPGNLKSIYFTNSGSEANDLAMLMARTYTGNDDFLALRNAYHGMSYVCNSFFSHAKIVILSFVGYHGPHCS